MTRQLDKNWEIEIIEEIEGLARIRPLWEHMQRQNTLPCPDADIDRYLARLEPIKKTSRPYIVIAYHDDQPRAMLIGRIGPTHIPCRIGHITFLKAPMRSIRVDHGGILGNPVPEVCSVLVDTLYKTLREGQADVAIFDYLPMDTNFYRSLIRKPTFVNRGHFSKIHIHWRMTIPQQMDDFYKKLSKKHQEAGKRPPCSHCGIFPPRRAGTGD